MHRRNVFPARGLRRSAIAAAALLAGCSMFNPYRASRVMPEGDAAVQAAALGIPAGLTLAGGVLEALDEVEAMRGGYYGDLKGVSVTRNATAAGATVLTGWAVYSALRSTAGGDAAVAAASEADRLRSLRIGAVLGSAYGLSRFFVNPEHESIYADGHTALTCLMLQARPLLWTTAAAGGSVRTGDYEKLTGALDTLEAQVKLLNERVAAAERGRHAAGRAEDKSPRGSLGADIADAREALKRGRQALQDGRLLLHQVDSAGYSIRARGALIVSTLNKRVQSTLRPLEEVKALVKNAQDISTMFRDIGVETELQEQTPPSAGPAGAAPVAWSLPGPAFGLTAAASASLWVTAAAAAAKAAPPAPAAARPPAPECTAADAADCDRAGLRSAIEGLYAERRKVVQPLLDFRELTRAVRSIPQCSAAGNGLVVTPNEDRRVSPGDIVEFVVSQRIAGTPLVALQGNAGLAAGENALSYEPKGPTTLVRLKIGANPGERLTLVVTDSSGINAERVQLLVVRPGR